MKPPDRLVKALGLLSLVPVLGLPLSNPDLFWHLSAARRIRETGALPVTDWLSATRAGAPWSDFEWASQMIFDAFYRQGGMFSLWAFKAALMAASALILLKTLELYTDSAPARWSAAALWGAASLTRSDIRPEMFSLIGFGMTFLALERRRLGAKVPGPVWFVPLFCVWGNLHPGFMYGLALIGLYAAAETAERFIQWKRPRPLPAGPSLWLYLAGATLGCMLQVYGLAHFKVIWRHWQDMGNIRVRISEWKSLRLDDPWHWPFWIALLSATGAALLLLRRRRWLPLGPLAALLFFGFSASRHSRMAAYCVACAVPLIVYFLNEAGAAAGTAARRWLLTASLAAFGAFALSCSLKYGFPRATFNDHALPRRAAEFLASEAAGLPRRGLYNPWGWGGYLGWRLHPGFLVFQDGRYLFHDLLKETGDALASPAAWQGFLGRHGVDLALMENAPLRAEAIRTYPDGSTKAFWRPYYLDFMPREGWALVYWDEKALIFARRGSVPAPWIEAHEYRLLRPYDEGAFEDARSRGEISPKDLSEESSRHDREFAQASRALPSW